MSIGVRKKQLAVPVPPGVKARQRKVYIAAFTGLFVVLGLLVAAIYGPHILARHDQGVYQRANEAAMKVNDYINVKSAIPDSLVAAGATGVNSDEISYKKLSDKSYTFCVTYRRAGTTDANYQYGSGGPVEAIYTGLTGGSSNYPVETNSRYLQVPNKHPAGRECQTITPEIAVQPLTESADGHTVVCGVKVSYYQANGAILKKEVVNVGLNNSPTLQPVTMIKVNVSNIPGDAGGWSYMYGPGSKAFDQQCKEISVDELKVGNTVGVYTIADAGTGSVSIFLKQ